MTSTATAFQVGDTVRYSPDVYSATCAKRPWRVTAVADGILTLTPAPGNDLHDDDFTVYHDEMEAFPRTQPCAGGQWCHCPHTTPCPA